MKSYLPIFQGFYETFFSYNNEGYDVESYNEEHGTNFNYNDFSWNYADYRQRTSKACCIAVENKLEELFPIKVKFENLVSPKFYNYSNDSINVVYSNYKLSDITNYLGKNWHEFCTYIKERYSDRSGFISHHSNNALDWTEDLESEHKFGTILGFILTNEDYSPIDLYESDEVSNENYIDYELSNI